MSHIKNSLQCVGRSLHYNIFNPDAHFSSCRMVNNNLYVHCSGHCLLDSCRQGDPQKLKKYLTADIINFKHPYTGKTLQYS